MLKQHLLRNFVMSIFLISPLLTFSMTYSVEEKGGVSDYCNWHLSGEIKQGDAEIAGKIFKNRITKCKSGNPSIWLNSKGGDVNAAYSIGRLLRQYQATTLINNKSTCLSACFFLYVSGVKRYIHYPYNQLGIHRPYFSDLSAGVGLNEIRAIRARQMEALKSYLNEMDIPLSVADVMMSVPPDEIKILTVEELNSFRLLYATDAAYEEKENAKQAALFGLSTGEYRRLRALAYQNCDSGKPSLNLSEAEQIEQSNCSLAVLWRLNITKYKQRTTDVVKQCTSTTDTEQAYSCMRRIYLAP